MRFRNRKLCILLLLVLIVSQLGLTVHVASHTSADHSVCQTCNVYNSTSHALVQTEFVFCAGEAEHLCPILPLVSPSTHFHVPYQQRAPPAIA